jgi:23S rRNA-/tRNA-specific pseudouridylate synthase
MTITAQPHTDRHEPPVTAEPLAILFEDDDIVAVNKPGSIPAHATGRYRHNTVIGMLARDRPGARLAGANAFK